MSIRPAIPVCILTGWIPLIAAGQSVPTVRATASVQDGPGGARYVATLTTDSAAPITVPLPVTISRVRTIASIPGVAAVALIGETRNGDALLRLSADGTMTARWLVEAASISPDGRLVLVERSRPVEGLSSRAEYSLVRLADPEITDTHAGTVFYPPDDRLSHIRRSDLFWVADDLAAFLDYGPGQTNLVVVRVNQDGTVAQQAVKLLDAALFVDASTLPAGTDPSVAIGDPTISKLPLEGVVLRLQFRENAHLKVTRADVTVW